MLMLGGALAFAQNRLVTGKVIDDKGDPVVGASVIIKGTSRGIPANAAGEFSISAKPSDVLVVTAASFGKSELRVGDQTSCQ